MKFYNYLSEKLSLSVAKKYRTMWTKEIQDRYKDLFNGKYRIYLPVEDNQSSVKPNQQVIEKLKELGYNITDYSKGLASKDNKNPIRIGKILSKFPDILKIYQTDPAKQGTKKTDLFVVISRHPYDLAGMSTDRGWRSCMDIETGSNRRYVCADIENGTLIAYLIKSEDKNIQNPIARVLIKPYYNQNEPKDILLVQEPKIYGEAGVFKDSFVKTVDTWLDSFQSEKQGIFIFNHALYNDNSILRIKKMKKTDLAKILNNLTDAQKEFLKFFNEDDRTDLDFIKKITNNEFNWIIDATLHKETVNLGLEKYISVDNIINMKIKFKSGTWIDGSWKDGTWSRGIWENGTWEDGTWNYGIWERGVWESGIWESGIWESGVWENGTWKNGTWLDGWWKDGIWNDGEWYKGTWDKGGWNRGIWFDGTWNSGFWFDGTWKDGTWKNGNWYEGTWENGTWKSGIWYYGVWKNGTWEDGVWELGNWEDGTWENGTWKAGSWFNGIFKSGVWKNGDWYDGTWKNGNWYAGNIYSKKFNKFIRSYVNPIEFLKYEKNAESETDLISKVR